MGKPQELRVESWEEFSRYDFSALQTLPFQLPFIFRGEPRPYPKPLIPSLLRPSQDPVPPLTERDTLDLEQGLLEEFQRHAFLDLHSSSNLPTPIALDDVIAWWLWMQHYGAPTRLLDWTRSQFVAAYFAVRDHHDEDGIVWVVNPHVVPNIRNIDHFPDMDTLRQTLLREGPHDPVLLLLSLIVQTPRMLAQQTMVTCPIGVLTEPEAVLQDAPLPDGDEKIARIIIPGRQKMIFLRRLAAMNVTATSLFPGLEGAARAAVESAALYRRVKGRRRERGNG